METRDLNKAVNRNQDRFPSDFMIRLTRSEFNNLKFQFGTSSWGGTRKLPKAFTEQGVAMLSSVLRSRRTVAFVDGQNLFHAAREAFGYTYPNYEVRALSFLPGI